LDRYNGSGYKKRSDDLDEMRQKSTRSKNAEEKVRNSSLALGILF
jgi:hypothetical protein